MSKEQYFGRLKIGARLAAAGAVAGAGALAIRFATDNSSSAQTDTSTGSSREFFNPNLQQFLVGNHSAVEDPDIGRLVLPTVTPTLAPTPTPTVENKTQKPKFATDSYSAELERAIDHWCGVYSVSCAVMHTIAGHESTSGTDPRAFDGSSGHLGPFQFNKKTWRDTPPGKRGESPNDAWAASEAAAWMIASGRRGEFKG